MLKEKTSRWLPPLVILITITLAYFPTFSGEFILDDNPLISKNAEIRESQTLLNCFLQEDGVFHRDELHGFHSGYYRPLVTLLYRLEYKLWGMHAPGFRITNLLLHILTCFVLYRMLLMCHKGLMAPMFGALLFGLHPVNTEAVSFVSAGNNILVTLFSLVSLHYYIRSLQERGIPYQVLSCVFFLLALLSKEFAAMLVVVVFLYNRFFISKMPTRNECTAYIPYLLILIGYGWIRWIVTESVLSPGGLGGLARGLYFAPYLIAYNLRLIFAPFGLHSFYVRYPEGLLGWEAIAGYGCLIVMGLLAFRYRRIRTIPFSVLCFIVGLFPVLNLLPTSAVSLISMRWLYFPLAFAIPLFSLLMDRFIKWKSVVGTSLASAIAIWLGMTSYFLNLNQWHDEDRFFHREVEQHNNLFYAGGLAETYRNRKDYPNAERLYELALRHFPSNAMDRINFADLLLQERRPRDALAQLERAKILKLTPMELGMLHNNEGMAYVQLKMYEKAIRPLEEAVKAIPKHPEFFANLGAAYGLVGRNDEAIQVLEKGLSLTPNSVSLKRNLAISYMKDGQYERAVQTLEGIPIHQRGQDSETGRLLKRARDQMNSSR